MCPHAGKFSIVTSNSRVKIVGQPVVTQQDIYTISGCPFTLPVGKPQPCVLAKWLMVATRVKIGGIFVVLKDSLAICQSIEQAPQGPPNIVVTQTKVKGQ
jgi:hypothetical protein